ncbi:c-type cytochrome [SAR86 cluster bacterium]|nr:c-type cytochrome [SAR86 cluster bacterium]
MKTNSILILITFVLSHFIAFNASANASIDDARAIYEKGCAACHSAGVAGAPMLGNKNQWSNRSLKGTQQLTQNAWDGIGGMPAKGLCQTCSFEEIKLAVQYMLEKI